MTSLFYFSFWFVNCCCGCRSFLWWNCVYLSITLCLFMILDAIRMAESVSIIYALPDKATLKDTDHYPRQPTIAHRPPPIAPVPIHPGSPTKLNRLWSQGSDAIFEEDDLERRSQGHGEGGLASPRPPPTPSVPPSPRQRVPSAASFRNAALSSSTSHADAVGRESVMSGGAYSASGADSCSESKTSAVSSACTFLTPGGFCRGGLCEHLISCNVF